MKMNVKNNIHWIGKIDWELRKFHGNEYSTHRGSTYNSYLIREQKTVVIDTVWKPFSAEFVSNLEKETDLKKIDFIVANHGEIDHSGSLPALLERIPGTPVYCTANGVKSLKGHYHADWNFKPVKTGDKVGVGNGKELVFIEAPMLHWPDTMMTYLTGDNVLFSNDAFGEHLASEFLFNDLVDQAELYYEGLKYYANILAPFNAQVVKKIEEVLALKLPLDVICPSHGVIWRKDPAQVVERYLKWAKNYAENQVTIVYDTMWNGTRVMAERIAKGLASADPDVNVKLYNVSSSDKNDVIAEVFRSKAVLCGSPTINRTISSGMAGILDEMKGLAFKGKKAAAFGTYGWSGESVPLLSEHLKRAGFSIVDDGLKALWNPDEESLQACFDWGKKMAGLFK